jgi:hypothetical protein
MKINAVMLSVWGTASRTDLRGMSDKLYFP